MPMLSGIRNTSIALTLTLLLSSLPAFGQCKVTGKQPTPAFDADKRLDAPAIAFMVLGDWGSGVKLQRTVAKAMTAKYNEDEVVAVLTTGDNIYPKGVSSATDPLWILRFENIYNIDDLPIPFYATLGNHDHTKSPDAQVKYRGKPLEDGLKHWNMPARNWSKVFTSEDASISVRVTGLDTKPLITGKRASRKGQIRWIDSVLALSTETWNIVIGHHPVYSNGEHGNTMGMIRQIKPLFEKHGVDAYFAGHDHDLQMLKPVNGVQYIISGAGGKARSVAWEKNTIFASTNGGFVWLQFNADEMLLQFIDSEGTVLFATSIPKN